VRDSSADDHLQDEEFHVRQALVYAENRFAVWDPKITTPPGLYLVAYVWLFLIRILHIPGSPEAHLRSLNTVGLVALWYVAWSLSDVIQAERQPKIKRDDSKATSEADEVNLRELVLAKRHQTTAHVALNVAAFPLLFFFGALFYTDVLSALFVLLAHLAFYKGNTLGVLVASSVSLLFRQTNIFWTAIYLAGLEARRELHKLDAARHGRRKPYGLLSWAKVAKLSWIEGALYDPDAPDASIEGTFPPMRTIRH
jgi:alpha-1,2-glucosyltransferase